MTQHDLNPHVGVSTASYLTLPFNLLFVASSVGNGGFKEMKLSGKNHKTAGKGLNC